MLAQCRRCNLEVVLIHFGHSNARSTSSRWQLFSMGSPWARPSEIGGYDNFYGPLTVRCLTLDDIQLPATFRLRCMFIRAKSSRFAWALSHPWRMIRVAVVFFLFQPRQGVSFFISIHLLSVCSRQFCLWIRLAIFSRCCIVKCRCVLALSSTLYSFTE